MMAVCRRVCAVCVRVGGCLHAPVGAHRARRVTVRAAVPDELGAQAARRVALGGFLSGRFVELPSGVRRAHRARLGVGSCCVGWLLWCAVARRLCRSVRRYPGLDKFHA